MIMHTSGLMNTFVPYLGLNLDLMLAREVLYHLNHSTS
jgi:hypothetical protein